MPIQSRTYTLDDLIAEFRDTMKAEGRTVCPVTSFLESKRGAWTIDDAEAWIASDEQYGPLICCDIIRTAGTHNPPGVTAEIQRLYAGYVTAFPWTVARIWIEKLLHADVPHGLDRQALETLLAYVATHHPNPKALLSKAEIIMRLPKDMDLTGLRCPDFEGLQASEVRGLGTPHSKGVSVAFGSDDA